ncbi:hypothetical protein CANMA_003193 [Candida margitis]|uniref:uncharacterized protein n=1 Tax=Candida margitis TaxID=1775924 RepID=UPI002225C65D|nr:uncharacterized protein CANMA_003193 [Candida margitis]KAI5967373.1 hypothetical protein CANMA_003193 [Candida margitis]
MPRSNQTIIIKVNVFGTKDNEDKDVPVEKTLRAKREDFLSINSKDSLAEYITTKLSELFPNQATSLTFTRKSKKHKCFIPLDDEEDFKSLARSLKVKNHVKLNVQVSSPLPPQASSIPTTESRSLPISSIDFAKLGDALLEATLEHFKDFFIEPRHKVAGAEKEEAANAAPAATASASTLNGASSHQNSSEVEEEVVVHENIACDNCSPDDFIPLKGVRYNCLVCQNYDLCSDCESRQQAGKLTYGSHSHLHPMAKITTPATFTRGFCNGKFKVNDMEPHGRHHAFPNTGPNDIVYDIPLSSCSGDNRARLETLLQSKGFERFIDEVDGIIGRSDKYSQLSDILKANGLTFSTEDQKHEYLEECIEDYLLKKAFTESQNEQQVESDNEKEEANGDAVISLNLGTASTKSSLQLINKSDITIDSGDFTIKLVDANQKEYSTTCKSAVVKPGQVKFYKLGTVPPEFVLDDGTKLLVEAPNVIMTSLNAESNEFQMAIMVKKSQKEQSETVTEIESFTSSSDGLSVNEKKEMTEFSKPGTSNGDITVSYKMQSGMIMNLELQNNSSTNFSCNDLKIEVYEQEEKVSESVIHRAHGIKPGCLTKANIILKNQVTKYPLHFDFQTNDNRATCSFSEGQRQSTLLFLYEEADTKASTSKEMTEHSDRNEASRSASELQSSSYHSVVLPVLARESVDLSEFMDANSGSTVDESDNAEYDVLEDDEIDSEYEILSLASTDSF